MNHQSRNFLGSAGEERWNEWDEEQSSSSNQDDEEPWTPSPPASPILIPNTPSPPPQESNTVPNGEGRNLRPCPCPRCVARRAGRRVGMGRGNYVNRLREIIATTTTTSPANNNNNTPETPRLTQTLMERFTTRRAPVGRGIGRGLPRQLNLDSEGSSNPGRVRSPSPPSPPSPVPTPPPRSPGWLTARRGRARARLDSERSSTRPTARVPPQPRDTRRDRREDENQLPSPLAQSLPSTPAREVGAVIAHPNMPLHTAELGNDNYLTSEERNTLVRDVEERLRAQPPLQWFLISAAVGGLPLTTTPPESTPAPPAAPPAAPPVSPGPGADPLFPPQNRKHCKRELSQLVECSKSRDGGVDQGKLEDLRESVPTRPDLAVRVIYGNCIGEHWALDSESFLPRQAGAGPLQLPVQRSRSPSPPIRSRCMRTKPPPSPSTTALVIFFGTRRRDS
ncbi:uncharacterized protein LOC135469938 [Liolophura sinensis]|uniref:uncharacterized protein LOC135469938 n=1 Tax=Liolophura sinensis TaxID=3198878 RepID=UPI0031593406